ncbi:MAG: hypothetical protein H3C35_06210 [Bacteroidetes bacterium]|nr:hypothetical protein [Bacteroidota bacterium]
MKKFFAVTFSFFIITQFVISQSVYLNADHPIYKFLDKMEAKHFIIDYRDEVKPITRENIAKFIMQIDSSFNKLTSVERDELVYYKEEFFQELKHLNYDLLLEERFHVYEYHSEPTSILLDFEGLLGYRQYADGRYVRYRKNGIHFYGNVGTSVGFDFDFHDNHDEGTYLDGARTLTSDPAQPVFRRQKNFIEYSPADVQLTYEYSIFTLSVEKLHNVWGNGENGNLILSTKAPSFPQIKLQAQLSKDFTFTYIHGWLYSGIVDSARSLQNATLGGSLGYHPIYRQKYIASHMLEMTPFYGVDIAVGESEVYGGRNPELLYLIPVMFFKAGEWWGMDSDNSQIFASVDLNIIPKYNWYFSTFIDELAAADIFTPAKTRNQLGFTVGTNMYDLGIENTRLNIEYTRINPWVYNHRFSEDTYQSHSIDLGHWIGQNAELFSAGYYFQPLYNLKFGLKFQNVVKGGKDSTLYQYTTNNSPRPFLYGPNTKLQSFGIEGTYEPLRDIVFEFHFFKNNYSSQNALLGADYSGKYDFLLNVRYNIWE